MLPHTPYQFWHNRKRVTSYPVSVLAVCFSLVLIPRISSGRTQEGIPHTPYQFWHRIVIKASYPVSVLATIRAREPHTPYQFWRTVVGLASYPVSVLAHRLNSFLIPRITSGIAPRRDLIPRISSGVTPPALPHTPYQFWRAAYRSPSYPVSVLAEGK